MASQEINLSIESIIADKTFYIALNKDKKPYLKKEHNFGYYTQVQFAMGLAALKWCHFVVYFSLVSQIHICLCIIYTNLITRKITEMLRKW